MHEAIPLGHPEHPLRAAHALAAAVEAWRRACRGCEAAERVRVRAVMDVEQAALAFERAAQQAAAPAPMGAAAGREG